MRMRQVLPALTVALVAVIPATATAATKPGVSTGGIARLQPTTATLLGKVDPNGVQTSYFFQYGTTTKYTAATGTVDAGKGGAALNALGDVGSLTPNTKYHYRVVAKSSAGTSRGADRTFTTKKQPLGLSLGATPNPVVFGSPVTLSGNLSGTGNAGRTIAIKQNAFPFSAGLQPFGNQIVTDAAGNFTLPVLGLAVTTQYQAAIADQQSVASPILTLPVALKVSTSGSASRIRPGRKLRLSGSIRPARDGLPVSVQKKTSTGKWVTVATAHTRHRTADYSVYGRSVTVRHSGTYRVLVTAQGDLAANTGQQVTVRRVR